MPTNAMTVATKRIRPHGTDCDGVCCSGFFYLENISNAPPTDPSFTNTAISPIFKEENFAQDPDISRPALMQSLRLLTRLVDATMPFFHTIFFGKVVVLQKGTKTECEHIQLTDEKKQLTQIDSCLTRVALEALADRIKFRLGEERSSETNIETDASTGDLHATISLSKTLHNAVVYAYSNPTLTDQANDAWLHTKTASTLGHELAHAVLGLTHGDPLLVYFGDSAVAEEGYEWETRALGGVLSLIPLDKPVTPHYTINGTPTLLKGQITFRHWPNLPFVKLYQDKDWPIAVRDAVPEVHMVWNTSMTHFLNFFQTTWWDTEYVRRGVRVVRLTKMTGRRCQVNADGKEEVYDSEDEGERTSHAVPRGYEVNDLGLVVPIGVETDIESIRDK